MGVCRGLVLSAVGIVKRTRTLVPSLCLNFVSFRVHIIIAALGRVSTLRTLSTRFTLGNRIREHQFIQGPLQLEVLLPAPVGGGHRQALQRKVLFKVVAGPGPSPSLSLSLSDHVKLSRKTVLSHLTVISHCHVGQLISPVFTVTG